MLPDLLENTGTLSDPRHEVSYVATPHVTVIEPLAESPAVVLALLLRVMPASGTCAGDKRRAEVDVDDCPDLPDPYDSDLDDEEDELDAEDDDGDGVSRPRRSTSKRSYNIDEVRRALLILLGSLHRDGPRECLSPERVACVACLPVACLRCMSAGCMSASCVSSAMRCMSATRFFPM